MTIPRYLMIFLCWNLLSLIVIVRNEEFNEVGRLVLLFSFCNLNLCNVRLHNIVKDFEHFLKYVYLYRHLPLHTQLLLSLLLEHFCTQFIYLFNTNIIFYSQDSEILSFREERIHLWSILSQNILFVNLSGRGWPCSEPLWEEDGYFWNWNHFESGCR